MSIGMGFFWCGGVWGVVGGYIFWGIGGCCIKERTGAQKSRLPRLKPRNDGRGRKSGKRKSGLPRCARNDGVDCRTKEQTAAAEASQ